MRSEKLFSLLVIAGGALAANLPACSGSTPDPGIDSGKPIDGGAKDTGTIKDTGTSDTGTGAEFW